MFRFRIELEETVKFKRTVEVEMPTDDEGAAEDRAWEDFRAECKELGASQHTSQPAYEVYYPWDDHLTDATDWESYVESVEEIPDPEPPEEVEELLVDQDQATLNLEAV